MLNPSLNHRSATRIAVFAICIVAASVTLPLAAMRAPEQTTKAVAVPTILVSESSPAPKAAVPESSPATPKRAPVRKLASAAAVAPAQGRADGSLTGTVYDGSGAVIPGATMIVSSRKVEGDRVIETEVETTTTGEAGNFKFDALPEGQYSLKANLPGFMAYRKAWIEVRSSQTVRENVVLSVGSLAERVAVTATGQPKPSIIPGIPRRIRVGGNVIAANLIRQVRPEYPQNARDAGIEGTVRLQGLISTEGRLIGLSALSSNDVDLTNAALEAVRQWLYKPTQLNGSPVEVLTTIDVEFKLVP